MSSTTAIDKIKALTALWKETAIVIAAIGGVASTFVSSQPTKAELPEEQLREIKEASQKANRALALSIENREKLDDRGNNFVPCAIRTLDRLLDATGVVPSCPLVMPK